MQTIIQYDTTAIHVIFPRDSLEPVGPIEMYGHTLTATWRSHILQSVVIMCSILCLTMIEIRYLKFGSGHKRAFYYCKQGYKPCHVQGHQR